MDTRGRRVMMATALALGAAVLSELSKAPAQRDWHGRIMGLVPYDLRLPTAERIARTFWDPQSPKVLVPHAFGVGWSVNVGRLARLVSSPTSAQD